MSKAALTMIANNDEEPIVVFTRFVHDWFHLLAHGNFAEALTQLDEPNRYGEHWSTEKIEDVLREYARTESVRIAAPDMVPGEAHTNLGEFADGHGYWFDHDVPLDGQWSDLTAQFEFLSHPSGFTVVLHDIHVL